MVEVCPEDFQVVDYIYNQMIKLSIKGKLNEIIEIIEPYLNKAGLVYFSFVRNVECNI